jgi:hypothetical protein
MKRHPRRIIAEARQVDLEDVEAEGGLEVIGEDHPVVATMIVIMVHHPMDHHHEEDPEVDNGDIEAEEEDHPQVCMHNWLNDLNYLMVVSRCNKFKDIATN